MSSDGQLRHRAATTTQSSTQHVRSHHSSRNGSASKSSALVSVRARKSLHQQLGIMENAVSASNIHDDNGNNEEKHPVSSSSSLHHHHHHHQVHGNSSSNHSNGNGWRNTHNSSPQKESFEGIDEEYGCKQHYYEVTSSSLLPDKNNNGGNGLVDQTTTTTTDPHNSNGNTMKKHNRIVVVPSSFLPSSSSATATIDHDGADHGHHHSNNNNNNKSDQRSKALYLKTAFWITAWYSTSLATLFLNKIILSRPNSSVHVLGMCQMTTAAVLGGWSTYGGLEYVTRMGKGLVDYCCCSMDAKHYKRLLLRGGGGTTTTTTSTSIRNRGGDHDKKGSSSSSSSSVAHSSSSDNGMFLPTISKSTNTVAATGVGTGIGSGANSGKTGGIHFHFARDMSIVGVLRGVTVLLGLVALEHVPVSFVETIKATAPAFTVLFARLILRERTAPQVVLTLVPVVGGLILCSASELRFDGIGFAAAVCNNCADCVQNVMSKRMLAHMKPTQLQFYTSVAALTLQTPLILRGVSGLVVRNWAHHSSDEEDIIAIEDEEVERHLDTTEDDGELFPTTSSSDYYYHHGEWSLTSLLIVDAIFYHLQSVSAYCTMGCMNPVSQSVANTLKRALLVWASILYFGNPVTGSGVVGILMVVVGVFLYNHVRRIHQS